MHDLRNPCSNPSNYLKTQIGVNPFFKPAFVRVFLCLFLSPSIPWGSAMYTRHKITPKKPVLMRLWATHAGNCLYLIQSQARYGVNPSQYSAPNCRNVRPT